ncbi:MAG TPA: glycosyl hydrolase, partial [Acidimicrobiia bacterium]|nr:glycosyl hydrolase [Acidimicrobiia bacterium]
MRLRRVRDAAVVLAIAVGAAACQVLPAVGSHAVNPGSSRPRTNPVPVPTTISRTTARRVTTGVYVPDPSSGSSVWRDALDQFDADAGVRPQLVQWYVPWASNAPFPTAEANLVRSRNQVPLITWEAWDWSGGADQAAYSLSAILAGRYDSYMAAWAQGARQYAGTIYLRVLAEANGNWNPWDPGVNGNTVSEYVQAWRHIRDVVRAAGASNIVWLWTPNVEFAGSTPLASIYPGDAYVDIVGLDGYNWGTTQPWSSWQSFGAVFDSSIANLRAITT